VRAAKNQKSETRNPNETRTTKSEKTDALPSHAAFQGSAARTFVIGASDFIRISGFGFQISPKAFPLPHPPAYTLSVARQPPHRLTLLLLLSLFLLQSAPTAASAAATTAPSTQPSGTITGSIISPADVPLSEMVVYLSPADDSKTFPVPHVSLKVSQKGAQFAPSMLIICVGQTVDFVNDEDRPIEHNVFSNSPAKQFDLGLYKPGESRSVTFDKTGPVFLYCSMHRHMDGVIYITPTPFFARVTPDSKYEIDSVPPGDWIVSTWQRRRRFAEAHVPVTVSAEKSTTADLTLQRK
jgi:plastocyanin